MKPFVLIMAGGKGERFWPRSTRAFPKQLHKIYSNKTLLQETIDRALLITDRSHIFVGCNPALKKAVLQSHDVPAENFILEPTGRNTAPIIALAALHFQRQETNSSMIVLSADHFIETHAQFKATLEQALAMAELGRLVTIGVRPNRPEIGYGYLKRGEPVGAGYSIEAFVEKPDPARAMEYLKSGQHFWNSGIFIWNTALILEQFRAHAPSIIGPLEKSFPDIDSVFAELPDLPVDIAIMEKSNCVGMVDALFVWDDVGSWQALERVIPAEEGNVHSGNARLAVLDSSDNIIVSDRGLVALLGLKNHIVVDGEGILFVADRNRIDGIKELLAILKKNPSLQEYL
jgi:mannose-1-phosphate guanylyltransferase